MKVLGIDIGGSSVKVAPVEGEEESWSLAADVESRDVQDGSVTELTAIVRDIVQDYISAGHVKAIGISTTGSVTPAGVVVRGGFFDGYENFSWRDELRDLLSQDGAKVAVYNDGKAAAWAAYLSRGDRTIHSSAHFVVGTGIGGGAVIETRPFLGEHGFSANFGHIKIAQSSPECVCGREGCVEQFAAAPAIARAASAALGKEVEFGDVVALYRDGADIGTRVFADAGRALGRAIADVASVLDCGVITIGGGVVEAATEGAENTYVEEAITIALTTMMPRVAENICIEKSSLGNDAGLVGAAALSARPPA